MPAIGPFPEVKLAEGMDKLAARNACWEFFINETRKYLHTALCFSSLSDKFRIRARQFPAILSGTTIDWFHAWSPDALVAVAKARDASASTAAARHKASVERSAPRVPDFARAARLLERERVRAS